MKLSESKEPSWIRLVPWIALTWGALIGSLTFAVGPLSDISANPFLAVAQKAIFISILPGLIGGIAFSGNVHAFSLGAGAAVNFIFHFAVSLALLRLFTRNKRNVKNQPMAEARHP